LGAFCAALLGCTRERDLVDEQVRQLCAKDGGVRVFERVQLAADQFDPDGEILVLSEKSSKPTDKYYHVRDVIHLRKGNPEMWRAHYKLIRKSDSKVLGEAISYTRRGGDLPGPWHPSSFGCPHDADISDISKAVFYK
jgi:hypothetical protein